MSAHPDSLAVDRHSADEQLERAAQCLAGGGRVRFERNLILRTTGRELHCEVVDPEPGAHRCANEYEVLIENARRALEDSPLHDLLAYLPQSWTVVEDDGASTKILWPIS